MMGDTEPGPAFPPPQTRPGTHWQMNTEGCHLAATFLFNISAFTFWLEMVLYLFCCRGYGGRACLFTTSRVVYEVFQEAAGGGHYGKWACWQNCNVCGGWAPSSHMNCSGPGWKLASHDKMWIQELGANVNAHSLLELSTILREVYQSPTGTCTINRHPAKYGHWNIVSRCEIETLKQRL